MSFALLTRKLLVKLCVLTLCFFVSHLFLTQWRPSSCLQWSIVCPCLLGPLARFDTVDHFLLETLAFSLLPQGSSFAISC